MGPLSLVHAVFLSLVSELPKVIGASSHSAMEPGALGLEDRSSSTLNVAART